MTNLFTPEEMQNLRAPFPLDKHIVREGHSEGGKVRWFVYIDRSAVQDRLDEMFPGEWETQKPELYPVETRTIKDDGSIETSHEMSATMGITIRGLTRWDGGESDDGSTKSALTNAFRRTAAYGWGIARYLYDMDVRIKTDSYRSKDGNGRWQTDWKKFDQVKQQAMDQFTQWYNRMFNVTALGPQNGARSRQDAERGDLPPTHATHLATPTKIDAETAKSNLAGNHAPANGEKKIIGRWAFDRNALLTALSPWTKDTSYQERNATVKKMDDEKVFTNCADLNEAVQLVVARLATHKKEQPA